MVCDRLLDMRDGNVLRFDGKMLQDLAREIDGDVGLLMQRGQRGQTGQRPFQLADVGGDLGGDEQGDFVGQVEPFGTRFLLQNRTAGFELGRLNIRNQAGLESVPQPFFEAGDVFGGGIRGEDDLFVRFMERIEGVEKLFLCAFPPRQELHVVDDQHVGASELVLELRHPVALDVHHQLVGERFRRQIHDPLASVAAQRRMSDRIDEVRLSEAYAAIDEERVVTVAGPFADGRGRGVRELVAAPDDKGREGEILNQSGFLPSRRLCRGRRRLGGFEQIPLSLFLDVENEVGRLTESLGDCLTDRVGEVSEDPVLEERRRNLEVEPAVP